MLRRQLASGGGGGMSMLLCIAAKARGGCLAGQPPPLHAEPVSGLIPFASALPISPTDAITDAKGISAKQVQSDEGRGWRRSEEHTTELQSLMRTAYAVFWLKNKNRTRTKQQQ